MCIRHRTVTVEDPNVYTRPWTISIPLTAEPDYVIYEYACHEGNYAIPNILAGARMEEATAAQPTAAGARKPTALSLPTENPTVLADEPGRAAALVLRHPYDVVELESHLHRIAVRDRNPHWRTRKHAVEAHRRSWRQSHARRCQ